MRDCTARSRFGEKVLVRQVTKEPRNRMNPRYEYGIWLGMRNNSAECFIGNADGVFRAREIRRLEPQDRWDTRAIHSVIGVPWRMTDGRWTVERPEVQVDPIPIPPLPFNGARVQRERITKQTLTSSEPRLDAQVAMQSRTTREDRHTEIDAGSELKNASEILRMNRKIGSERRSNQRGVGRRGTERRAEEEEK